MEIKNIYHNRIFSIQFDGSDMDEYNLAFSLWRDIEYLSNYFERNFGVIDKDFWRENNIPIDSLDEIISWVAKDAVLLEKFIKKLYIIVYLKTNLI
ncbi:MAG: hypothetical protein LIP09_12745 [Bacteroidales bacterium]|nr:hypothetical protein [Bacteroidales bacterium]